MKRTRGELLAAVRAVLEAVAGLDWGGLDTLTGGRRIPGHEVASILAEADVMPGEVPAAAMDGLKLIKHQSSRRGSRSWAAAVDLYDWSGRRSDLTLELTVFERQDGTVGVEIDNLHVL